MSETTIGDLRVNLVPVVPGGYRHTAAPCDHGADCLDCMPIFATLILNAVLDVNERLDRMEKLIMTSAETAQQHLDAGVASIRESVSAAVTELKNQIALGVPAAQLDFTNFDQLVSDEAAEAAADAPVAAPTDGGSDDAGTGAPEQPAPTDTTTPDGPIADPNGTPDASAAPADGQVIA